MIENNTSSQKEESFMELQERFLETMKRVLKDNPLVLEEISSLWPEIVKTSEQAGVYQPLVLTSFIVDILEYYHSLKMTQLSKKAYKLRKSLSRQLKERHEFNKLSLSRGAIPDHIFQHVQECQELEELEASL